MSTDKSVKTVKTKARVLLVDDDPIILDSLSAVLTMDGYEVTTAAAIQQAMRCLDAGEYNAVITDLRLPGGDGYELLRHVRSRYPHLPVIMTTGYGTVNSAIDAIRQGASDYLAKPLLDEDIRAAVARAVQQQRLAAAAGRRSGADRCSFASIVGCEMRMMKVLELAAAVADSRSTVLITGESGTGKSLIARAIHAQSPRRDGPFVEVSCGALPETLLESELFGHVRGAFTNALADKAGKFTAAEGGTIFLDEISSASPQLQVKLLRVLQERRFEPVGSNQTSQADVRVVLATNYDLWQEVQAGRFRRDLYYRVNVVNIELPPLRQRVEDIPLLAEHFLQKYLAVGGKGILGFSPESMRLMQRYDWPGKVRELENGD
jgi:DNA-binding NtrC family response regulator